MELVVVPRRGRRSEARQDGEAMVRETERERDCFFE